MASPPLVPEESPAERIYRRAQQVGEERRARRAVAVIFTVFFSVVAFILGTAAWPYWRGLPVFIQGVTGFLVLLGVANGVKFFLGVGESDRVLHAVFNCLITAVIIAAVVGFVTGWPTATTVNTETGRVLDPNVNAAMFYTSYTSVDKPWTATGILVNGQPFQLVIENFDVKSGGKSCPTNGCKPALSRGERINNRLPHMAVLGRVGDSQPFIIGSGLYGNVGQGELLITVNEVQQEQRWKELSGGFKLRFVRVP